MDYKIGDLVKPTRDYSKTKKHTSRQCKIGMIISYDRFEEQLLYKIFWWPYGGYFFFPSDSLELVSRVKLEDSEILKPLPLIKKPSKA